MVLYCKSRPQICGQKLNLHPIPHIYIDSYDIIWHDDINCHPKVLILGHISYKNAQNHPKILLLDSSKCQNLKIYKILP